MSIWNMTARGDAQGLDAAEMRRALAILVDPDGWVNLRGLDPPINRVVRGSDLDALVATGTDLGETCRNVYYALNPVVEGSASAVVGSVLERRWLLIDVDPIRPAEHVNDPATEGEKDSAKRVGEMVIDHLSELGWPLPLLVDSGNGCHVLYRVDLPNDKLSQALVKRLLNAVADKFSGHGATIDRKCHDAPRIAKLPGSVARKGTATEERPFRPCKILFAPDAFEVLSLEMIHRCIDQWAEPQLLPDAPARPPAAPPASPGSPWQLRAGSTGDLRAYARKALQLECARVALATPGGQGGEGRNNVLYKAAANLGEIVAAGWIMRQEVEVALTEAACRAGLDSDPNCGERGIARTIKGGLDKGSEQPRAEPKPMQGSKVGNVEIRDATDEKVKPGELIIERASEITPKQVEWLWPARIPLGKLTTFAGVGGLGKTFVLCDIAARVSRGLPWPDRPNVATCPGQVLFISGEDNADDTLVPRMIELGADLKKICFLRTEVQDRFTLMDLKTLDLAIQQIGTGVRFVAVDPPTAYLGGINDHKNSELRALLSPLKNWAARHNAALIFNTHFTKPQGNKVEAMMRVMGSVAWVNAVRAAHMFCRDPEDRERRLFIGMKNNLGPEIKGLAYKLAFAPDQMPHVEWLGEVDATADEAVNREQGKKPRRRISAAEWLEEVFACDDRIASRFIWDTKKTETTISDDALKEAKEDMGIRARREVDDSGKASWFWEWSSDARTQWAMKKTADKRNGSESPH